MIELVLLCENMAEHDLIIRNGLVVTADEIGEYDIAIKDEKIARVVPKGELNGVSAKKEIDAKGGYVMVHTCWLC
jgi:dihydropyrimidinase